MKRFFTHLLLIAITLAIPVAAYAAYPSASYQLSADGKTLLNWNGTETVIDLTSDPVFNTVTTISGTAFRDKTAVTSIVLTNNITTIGDNAFAGMTSLTSLTLPTNLTTIPTGLLLGSNKITAIVIPASVTAIGNDAFNGCAALTTVNIPAGVTAIGNGAFSNVGATTLTLPSGLTSIGMNAFNGAKITTVTIPAGITAIPEGAFANCTALATVNFSASGLQSIGDYAFEYTTALGSITIPNGVTTLGNFVFRGSGIASASMSNAVTFMGSNVFLNCSSLATANLSSGLSTVPNGTFGYCLALTSIDIPASVTTIGNYAFQACRQLESVTLPANLVTISDGAFSGASKFTTIHIPAAVKNIGAAVFHATTSLAAFTVDAANTNFAVVDGVLFNKDISTIVFYPIAKTATSYTIPNTVTMINTYAFSNNPTLTSVVIPNSVTIIGKLAFNNCTKLQTANIPSSVRTIETAAFNNCIVLAIDNIPASVTTLGGGAFANINVTAFTVDAANPNYMAVDGVIFNKNQTRLVQYPTARAAQNYTIPGTVTFIDEYAFFNAKITGIDIPNSVAAIGSSAFSLCQGLTSVVLPNSLNIGAQYVFDGCTNLANVVLPENITYIGPRFFNNTGLTSIKIPASVINIGTGAFGNCTKLREVEVANPIPPSLTQNNAFDGVNQSLVALTVPLGSKYTYKTDNNQWRNFALANEKDYTGAAFWFQTTAASGSQFTFTIGHKTASGTVKVDWGDGTSNNNYAIGASTAITGALVGTAQGTPPVLAVRVYGDGIHLLDLSGKPVTFVNTSDNEATLGALEVLNITGTAVKSFDVSKNINLTDLNITGLALTNKVLNLSANTKLANLNAANIGLTALTLPTSNTLKAVNVSGNALTTITLPASLTSLQSLDVSKNQLSTLALPTALSSLTSLNVSYNKLNIGTLPTKPENVTAANYIYSPQTRFTLPYDKYEKTVDLSSQNNKTGVAAAAQATTYNWYRADNNVQLVAGTDYSVTDGVTTFLKTQLQGVYAVMTTPAFPNLKSYTGTVASPVLDGGLRTQPASITAAGVIVTLVRTFLGTTSSDWNTATNWGNNTPAADNDDVQISPTAPNDLLLDKDRTLNSVTNNSTKAIVIPAGTALTVLETMTVNAPDRILIKSDAAKANGSLLFAKPAQNTAVQASVEFYSKASSDATGRLWQYFGTPVSDVMVGPVFGTNTVRAWNESSTANNNLWVASGGTLKAFTGYQVTQPTPATYTFKGTLVTANQSRTLGRTTGALYAGQHVLANPFTAAIDINKIVFGNTADIDNTVYIYNTGSLQNWKDNLGETTPGNNPGQYTAVPVGQAGFGPDGAKLPATIPGMQGFLVKVMGTTGTITIPYSATIKNSEMLRSSTNVPSDILSPLGGKLGKEAVRGEHLVIDVQSQNTTDRLWLFTVEGASDAFDNGWDGHKIFMSGATQLYTVEQGGNFQVSTRGTLDGTNVGFIPGEDGQYMFTFRKPAFEGAAPLYLLDTKTGTARQILNGGTYWFSASANDKAERFIISTRADLPETVSVLDGVKVFVRDNRIVVINTTSKLAYIKVFDIFGRPVFTGNVAALTEQTLDASLGGGAYLVKVNEEKQAVKVLVK